MQRASETRVKPAPSPALEACQRLPKPVSASARLRHPFADVIHPKVAHAPGLGVCVARLGHDGASIRLSLHRRGITTQCERARAVTTSAEPISPFYCWLELHGDNLHLRHALKRARVHARDRTALQGSPIDAGTGGKTVDEKRR
jgi:hypothetical protein